MPKIPLQKCKGGVYAGKIRKPLCERLFYQWKSIDYTYFEINDAKESDCQESLIIYSCLCVGCALKSAINPPLTLHRAII